MQGQGNLWDAVQREVYGLYDGTPPHEQADTSLEAAFRIEPDVGRLQGQVLAVLSSYPDGLIDEQGIELTGMAANTWRPRRRELELLHRVHHDGTRLTRSGRRAKVWHVTPSTRPD